MSKRDNSDLDSSDFITPDKKARMSEDNSYRNWDKDEVYEYFVENGQKEIAEVLLREKINGENLTELNHHLLTDIGFSTLGERLTVLSLIRDLTSSTMGSGTPSGLFSSGEEYKVFNDPVHGHIDLHPLCVAIIDTPQFQRLRYLKQLGACYFVFPGASHNRFEHSLGVCHLAGELVKTLNFKQPELCITAQDILCVQIAGLCHDLGHGPFSHLFDSKFIPEARPDHKWQHEQASVDMFDHLVKENSLEQQFSRYGLEENDRNFIKEQIAGPLYRDKNKVQTAANTSVKWLYKGRDKSKSFLYEIVANKRNGIDVDKWDYFSRDCHHLGISTNFDHSRFMKFSRVIDDGGEMQICNRDKEVRTIYDMFYTRSVLHQRAYQHKTCMVIELMIKDALLKADDYVKIEGQDKRMCKMSECIEDMVAMTKLTDNIYHTILHSSDPNLKAAREILQRIESRRLYKFIAQTKPIRPDAPRFRTDQINEITNDIAASMVDEASGKPLILPEDVVVGIVNIDYGKKDNNPIDSVRFYNKNNCDKTIKFKKDQVSQMLPEKFSEQFVRVYSRSLDKDTINYVRACFVQWCTNKDMIAPKDGDLYNLDMTPLKPSPFKCGEPSPEIKKATKNKLEF